MATALRGGRAEASLFHYSGSRNRVRRAAARDALRLLTDSIRRI
ncbi:MAG: hypothetical protein LBQ14_10915 [Treponema sp.]|nr:hypothetical protein [Treponema sp.]